MWFDNLFVLIGTFMGQSPAGQLMSQNSKVVHWPEKALEAAELQPLIREGIMVLRPLGVNDELDRANAHLWNKM